MEKPLRDGTLLEDMSCPGVGGEILRVTTLPVSALALCFLMLSDVRRLYHILLQRGY